MASDRRYYDDSYTTLFKGDITDVGVHAGRPAVELGATWFYPESGGQLADLGTIAGSKVLDVQVDEESRVWHVVDTPPSGRALACEIDWPRRFDHMQQHTGQHILSAAFERLKNAALAQILWRGIRLANTARWLRRALCNFLMLCR